MACLLNLSMQTLITKHFGNERKTSRNPWLDLVRAIAIALVLLRHGYRAIVPSTEIAASGFWQNVFANGWVGVDLFFVLSGYLISQHLIRHGLGTNRFVFWRYATMRALRIVPAYFAVLAMILLVAFPYYTIDRSYLTIKVLYHVLFLQDYLPSNINVVFWSLGVEEKFYLIAPGLIWFSLKCKTLKQTLGMLLLIVVLVTSYRFLVYLTHNSAFDYALFFRKLRSPFHFSLEPLLIGVALALAQNAGVVKIAPNLGKYIFGIALVTLIAWLGTHEFMFVISVFDVIAQPIIIACLCGLLTLGAVQMHTIAMPCEAVVRTIAQLSYSLYLVHYPLLPLTKVIVEGSKYSDLIFWLTYCVLTFAVACLLHYSIERSFLRLKDQMAAQRLSAA